MTRIFTQEEIDKAALKSSPKSKSKTGFQYGRYCEAPPKGWKKHNRSFNLGVEFAESKVEEIAIEFANYIEDMVGEFKLYESLNTILTRLSNYDLFQEFLKQRNNESRC